MAQKKALVSFGAAAPAPAGYAAVFAGEELEHLCLPGDIYAATTMLEELQKVPLGGGVPAAKAFVYNGFELWWMHYDSLFHHFCLPYTRYKPLLECLREFDEVHLSRVPHAPLFETYLEAHGVRSKVLRTGLRSPEALPLGVALQMLLSFMFFPALVLLRRRMMVYIGDKLEPGRDYDFRLGAVYHELRAKKLPFVEYVRGVESWRKVLAHAWRRRRPVFYSETAVFLGRFLSRVGGGRAWARRRFGERSLPAAEGEQRFKQLVAALFLKDVYADVWAIRIMRFVVAATGLRAALIAAGSERNFPTLLACKLRGVPVVGLMHGVVSPHYMVSDFMQGWSGGRPLAVDRYGVWSDSWREKYLQHSRLYTPDSLVVSGAMRPLRGEAAAPLPPEGSVRVLFVAEQAAAPEEAAHYLEALLRAEDLQVSLKFRPYRDGFEQWLQRRRPELLAHNRLRTLRGSMEEAVRGAEVVVGSHSTGVLEALLQGRVPLYFKTKKWGDYHELNTAETRAHFAADPGELLEKIRAARAISPAALEALRERYFGDPHKNGSAWAVGELERFLKTGESLK